MNKLQAIPNPGHHGSPGRVLVTMNPTHTPRSSQSSQVYHHPLISSESFLASRRLHEINGVWGISFAGAWMGYGFHEDGFSAGSHAAEMLICGRDKVGPLDIVDTLETCKPRIVLRDALVRAAIAMVQRML